MKKEKTIVITADDFGLCESVNKGVLDCCAAGAVSSVSVLACGEAFASGIRELAGREDVGLGVHLCLDGEKPLSRPGLIPSLLTADGRFPPRGETFRRIIAGKLVPAQVYIEWKAQIEAFLDSGAVLGHLDSHNHVHLFPELFRIATHLAEEYGALAIRLPGVSGFPGFVPGLNDAVKLFLAARLAGKKEEAELRGINACARVFGFYGPGLTAEKLRSFAGWSPAGEVSEIITHPGRGKPGSHGRFSSWELDWEAERDILVEFSSSGGWKKFGAELTAFGKAFAGKKTEKAAEKIRGLSIVIPAFNEKENISKTLRVLGRYLDEKGEDCEVIVVDDGSSDGTGETAAALLSGGRGKVVRTPDRRGYGFALRAGFDAASKKLTAYFDGDYPAHVSNLGRFFGEAKKADMVIGFRENSLSEGLVRFVYRHVYGRLVRILLGIKVSDVNFAFKIFRTADWKSFKVRSEGSFIDAELVFRAVKAGLSVKEVPVRLLTRTFGKSRLANPRNIRNILGELFSFALETPRFLVLRSYFRAGFPAALHAAVRLLTCPLERIEERLPRAGKILDFGCGIGLLSRLAAANSPDRTVFGLDPDERKVEAARLASAGDSRLGFSSFVSVPGADYDAAVVSDVLYLMPRGEKEKTVAMLFKALRPGGTLLVKETDPRPAWKAAVNGFQEFLSVKLLGFTAGEGVFVEGRGYYEKLLAENGFEVSVSRLDSGYLHPHILYEARKPADFPR